MPVRLGGDDVKMFSVKPNQDEPEPNKGKVREAGGVKREATKEQDDETKECQFPKSWMYLEWPSSP